MNAYVYQAALLCEECAQSVLAKLAPASQLRGDSDSYPQGPYSDGGGEADSPQHCDMCGTFLENPLTSDGYEYTRQQCEERLGPVTELWAEFYEL